MCRMKAPMTNKAQPTAVGYLRVSTTKQEDSGLGLGAQRAAIEALAAARGMRIVGWFEDVQSGTAEEREGLMRALAACRRFRATLIVKRLDRLSRKMSHALRLTEDNNVLLADTPNASPLEVKMRALIAAEEAELIARRTREAMALLKARGVLLGSRRPGAWDENELERLEGLVKARAAALKGAALRRELAREEVDRVERELIEQHGVKPSLRQLADALNHIGLPSTRNGRWTASSVLRLRRAS